MSTRPRRATANQKDTSNDMLGLSRQEERMLQRAMYDSLRQPNKFKFQQLRRSQFRKNSMTTRSMATNRLTISVPDLILQDMTEVIAEHGDYTASADDNKVVEQEIKRGTRYSPMRKGPLSEMLKSLENKKTLIDTTANLAVPKSFGRRSVQLSKKKDDDSIKDNAPMILTKSPKIVGESVAVKRVGRPKLIKNDNTKRLRMTESKSNSLSQLSGKGVPGASKKKVNQRTPRSASLAARSYWLSQSSDSSSPNRYQTKAPVASIASPSDNKKPKTTSIVETKVPKHLIYNRKSLSRTQRMSRNILATAAKRVKRAKLKSDVAESSRRNGNKPKSTKVTEVQNSLVIPPELWLDPKGQPVDTQDFINFLLYRDTPYLDSSLKWFHLPPHRRKQRFYRIIESEPGIKFNQTLVYTEKKEGGGKEVVVHCIPPKLVEDGSELVSSTSEQSSTPGDNKTKLSASANSSCYTHAAVDEESTNLVSVDTAVKPIISPGPDRHKAISAKTSPVYEYRSKHIMQTRNRRS